VTVQNEIITIAPATPEVVYVPTYDPQVVYTTPAPSVPYIVDNGNDLGNALATGAIVFGTAILLDSIFDNNNNDWNGYWGGSRPIDWNNGDFHPRPGIGGDVNIDRGDININNGRITNIDRNTVKIDRDNVKIDRDRARIDGQRPGNFDRDQLDRARDKGFTPAPADRDVARAKIEERKVRGEGVATLPAVGPKGERLPQRQANASLPKMDKPAARVPSTANLPSVNRPANVSKPKAAKLPTASRPSPNAGSFKPSGGSRAAAASNRGRSSGGGGRGGGGGRRG
jgi:hypothetical protein